MQKSVLNKWGKFGVKILWRYTDMAIFVLRCFILTHPVDVEILALYSANRQMAPTSVVQEMGSLWGCS